MTSLKAKLAVGTLAFAAACFAAGTSAHANVLASLSGSDTMNVNGNITFSGGATDSLLGSNGSSVDTNNVISMTGVQVTGSGTLDFAPTATPNGPSGTTVTDLVLNLGNLSNFSFTISGFGTFAAGPVTISGTQYAPSILASSGAYNQGKETLNVYEVGTFTPSGNWASTYAPTSMSMTFAFTETGSNGPISSGGSTGVGISFGSPAAVPTNTSVPEPFTAALLGSGLLMLGAVRYRRSH